MPLKRCKKKLLTVYGAAREIFTGGDLFKRQHLDGKVQSVFSKGFVTVYGVFTWIRRYFWFCNNAANSSGGIGFE